MISENAFEIEIKGLIEDGWHTYSTKLPMSDEGPLGCWITFEPSDSYQLIDEIIEENAHSYYDETWKMDIIDFSKEAIFKQKIKISDSTKFILKGNVNFMVCKDGSCLPPEDYKFEIVKTQFTGNSKVNRKIENYFLRLKKKNDTTRFFEIKTNSQLIKKVTSKNTLGEEASFSIKIIVLLEVFENNENITKSTFEKTVSYNNLNSKFELKQYENILTEDIVDQIILDISTYLSSIK